MKIFQCVFLAFVLTASMQSFAQNSVVQKKSVKTTEEKFQLSAADVERYNSTFEKFLVAVQNNNPSEIKNLLSLRAQLMVTDAVLIKLREDIDFSRKLVIFKTGYKSVISGKNYPMIQYRYATDKNKVPQEIITAVFEENAKILGVKPFKMLNIK